MAIILGINVPEDKNLTDSDKATYLHSTLKSKEAVQIITSKHSVNDYDEMVTALKRSYSNPHCPLKNK